MFVDFKEDDFYKLAGRYTDRMARVAATYPEDLEAQVFYALALLNSDPPDDVALTYPRKAVAILEPLFREHPGHPRIAHYIIHATDNPKMAHEGLEAARQYSKIVPAAPHALHMPAHIFARLGLWKEDIRANLASKATAEDPEIHAGPENRLHAMAAGHLHDAQEAKRLEAAADALLGKIPLSQRPTATLPNEIRAWARFAQGKTDEAVALLRPIADRQASIGRGEVEIPAREMLAEMLLLDGNVAGALTEYQVSLAGDPNRFSALVGAIQAARTLGDRALADHYYRILSSNCTAADDTVLERLKHLNSL
jgi:hypothetical protein